MILSEKSYTVRGLHYVLRSAKEEDASPLAALRLQIDGETEFMDRERGEAVIDPIRFAQLIQADADAHSNLFLVAVADGQLAGYSRCQGSELKRLAHKVEFGVGVPMAYWGHKIGEHLLTESIAWADETGIKKMALSVLETNEKAIRLYEKLGFEREGLLRRDKLLSDGAYYNTILMGRLSKEN
ncbi:GNAT family N-acetyltransferase [Gorillibacterium sp. CAU 1737]|uniref:GNAT family N-acetyltransferase n=1 Tax=Gorillibacterium sp. CAU 1737 TaxID=3140362 RepID=UPI003260ABDA